MNNNYYILYVDKKMDADATAAKKKQMIAERKQTAVDDQYTEWEKDVTFTTDDDAYGELTFDRSYTAPETTATEAASGTEAGGTEAGGTERYGTEAETSGTVTSGTEADTSATGNGSGSSAETASEQTTEAKE